MAEGAKQAILSFSGGKDSVHALDRLLRSGGVQITGLLTTFRATDRRIPFHDTHESLVRAQSACSRLPLFAVYLPDPCPDHAYEAALREAHAVARQMGADAIAYGDVALEDLRQYRIRLLEGTGLEPIFPLWGENTALLAEEIIESGLRAVVTCIDRRLLPRSLLGREFDRQFLAELPRGVDPCGERGEFHTFAYAGPRFRERVEFRPGDESDRGDFRTLRLEVAGQADART